MNSIPNELKSKPNWVGFRVICKEDGSIGKMPIDCHNGKGAKSNTPDTWCGYEDAVKAMKRYRYDCIGFAFDGDGIIGIDIDHCIENGEPNALASEILGKIKSYTELSPSGTGLHVLARCRKPLVSKKKNGLEIYTDKRFFTVTGQTVPYGCEVFADCTDEIVRIYDKYFAEKTEQRKPRIPDTVSSLSDDEIIDLAKKAKNGIAFSRLYCGDTSGYGSQSEADLALCTTLAFWTAKNNTQIDGIFRRSGLMRAKWDEKRGSMTYGEKTVQEAVNACQETYSPKRIEKQRVHQRQIIEVDSCYLKVKGNGETKELTNFVIKPIEILEMDGGGYINTILTNNNGQRFEKQFAMKDFCNVQSFKKVLNTNTIALSFKGTDTDLELVKEHLATQTCPVRQCYPYIGVITDSVISGGKSAYVGETGTIDSNGNNVPDIVTLEKSISIRSDIERREEITGYELEQVGKLLMTYNELPKTAAVLTWCAACFAKPKLWERGVKFPHLVMVGEQGSGKSSTYEKVIMPFFSTGASVGASRISQFSLIQAAGSSNCIPYGIDEYKPSTMEKAKVDLINNFLRDVFDGHEAARGRADMTVKRYNLDCPVVLVGEESPVEASLKERTIELLFSKLDIVDKKGKSGMLDRMKPRIMSLGKAVLLAALKETTTTLKTIYTECVGMLNTGMEDRVKNSVAVCMVGLFILDQTCKAYGTEFATVFGVSKDEVKRAIVTAVEQYTLDGGTYNKTIIDKTFEVFDRMTEILRVGTHYKQIGTSDIVVFDIKAIYDLYTKYHRDMNLQDESISYSMFTKQLRKKSYFVKYDTAMISDKCKKCWYIDFAKLMTCADVSNMQEVMRIPSTRQRSVFDGN